MAISVETTMKVVDIQTYFDKALRNLTEDDDVYSFDVSLRINNEYVYFRYENNKVVLGA